jgi:DNA-binding MarR family transcriptional regulator
MADGSVRRGDREPDYPRLLAFREALRRFVQWMETQAREQGITPAQHQLMLCVRGNPDGLGPTITDVAESLLLRHHSAVELIDRAVSAGLVRRHADANSARTIRIRLTSKGSRILRLLSVTHEEEVARLATLIGPFIVDGAESGAER